MDNYEEQSDFDLNKAVAEILGLTVNHHDANQSVYLYANERTGIGRSFDPCNNPSDAWPLITENEICIHQGEFPVAFLLKDYWGNRVESISNKPLRAAMIVYLKMQEA